jgi:hypothetical protein
LLATSSLPRRGARRISLDLEEYHLTEQALRRLLWQVRIQLQQTDTYDGSKLQQLGSFEVKLTQL